MITPCPYAIRTIGGRKNETLLVKTTRTAAQRRRSREEEKRENPKEAVKTASMTGTENRKDDARETR